MRFLSVIALIMVLMYSTASAKTTRDIGQEPVLEWQKTAKWIAFYTNIERIEKGIKPLMYDPLLEKAAVWQAEYCAKKGGLNHYSDIKDMRAVNDRINHFGANYNACGENLTVKFNSNGEGMPFAVERDEKGEYLDFGAFDLHWRDERQMAYAMVESWMKSPGHRENILKSLYTLIGAGTAKGVYSNMTSYYGCQVFGLNSSGGYVNKPEDEFFKIEIIKNTDHGEVIYTISYKGSMDVGIVEVNRDDKPVSRSVLRNDNIWTFKKDSAAGRLFVVLFDKGSGIIYPAGVLK